jgi:Bacterial membrane protein YfhO
VRTSSAADPTTRARPTSWRRAAEWVPAHPSLVAALVYAVLSLVMVGQGLLPGRAFSGSDLLYSQVPWLSQKPASAPAFATNFELADAVDVFQPFFRFTRAQGRVPLWNSHIMGGRPFVGNAQSQVFSPYSVPSYMLSFWDGLAFAAALKLFVAAFGTFLLGRTLGMRFGGALLAGVAFAFGTFFIVWLSWPLASIFSFIPWLLLCTELLIRRPGPLPAAALALVVGLQFTGGHPESNFHALAATGAWFAFRLVRRWRRAPERSARSLARPVLVFAGAIVLGAGLAMLALAPFLELLLHSGDLSRRLGNQEASYWPRKYIGALFLHDYWGRPTQTDIEPFMTNRGWYAGGLTLMLAAAALILRPTATRIALLVFALASTCMVIGIDPVFSLVERLPGFSTAHNERLLIYVLFALALLAGFGLDELCERPLVRPARRRLVIGAAALLFAVPVAWMVLAGTLEPGRLGSGLRVAWGFEHPPPLDFPPTLRNAVTTQIVQMSALLIWLPLAAAALGLIVWRLQGRRPLAASVFVALAVALLAADLFRANLGFNPSIPVANASQPATPAIRYLQGRRPMRFVGLGTQLFAQPMPSDNGMTYGLYDARGYDYPVEKHFDRLWRRSVAPSVGDFTQPVAFSERSPAAVRALSLLSVSDLVADPREARLRLPGVRVGYRGRDAVVYANSRALPRVLLVDRQRTVTDENAALTAVTAPGFDGRRVAVTQRPIPGLAQAGAGSPPDTAPGYARLISYADERVAAESRSPIPSLLVLTDVKYPGWKATVDGRSVPIERVDYLLRGVPVPAGRHRVEMRYEPASWRAGWIVSLVSLLVLVALVVVGLRGRRRPWPASTS